MHARMHAPTHSPTLLFSSIPSSSKSVHCASAARHRHYDAHRSTPAHLHHVVNVPVAHLRTGTSVCEGRACVRAFTRLLLPNVPRYTFAPHLLLSWPRQSPPTSLSLCIDAPTHTHMMVPTSPHPSIYMPRHPHFCPSLAHPSRYPTPSIAVPLAMHVTVVHERATAVGAMTSGARACVRATTTPRETWRYCCCCYLAPDRQHSFNESTIAYLT